ETNHLVVGICLRRPPSGTVVTEVVRLRQLISVAQPRNVQRVTEILNTSIRIAPRADSIEIVVGGSNADPVCVHISRGAVQNVIGYTLHPAEGVADREEQSLIVKPVGHTRTGAVDDIGNLTKKVEPIRG